MTRRDRIIAAAENMAVMFTYYNRKEDEELPVGELEAALSAGEVSVAEIVGAFRVALERELAVSMREAAK